MFKTYYYIENQIKKGFFSVYLDNVNGLDIQICEINPANFDTDIEAKNTAFLIVESLNKNQ